jgi:argininosuccinate synthase
MSDVKGEYLLEISIAHPLSNKRIVDIVRRTSADAISQGAAVKGGDQLRFELGTYGLKLGNKGTAPRSERAFFHVRNCSPMRRNMTYRSK